LSSQLFNLFQLDSYFCHAALVTNSEIQQVALTLPRSDGSLQRQTQLSVFYKIDNLDANLSAAFTVSVLARRWFGYYLRP
jgi:hypothetical protein